MKLGASEGVSLIEKSKYQDLSETFAGTTDIGY
jgi:hypothetical protein